MKLATKLLLFIAGSKLVVAALFILLLPFLVDQIASEYTNYILKEQQEKVMDIVAKNGIQYYLQGEKSYGSYTLLKEEYIALEPYTDKASLDTIKDTKRIIEGDTLNYRVLSHTFYDENKPYLLEVGKTIASIHQYNQPLQRFALYVLISLIVFTVLIDVTFTRLLVKPLGQIIKSRLVNRKFPFKEQEAKIKTSTTDFSYLDESILILMRQINEAFAKEREFTANASHELMTPISILQHKLENLLRDEDLSESAELGILETMKTLDRLKKISSSLLLISRIDNEQFVKRDEVNPVVLLQEILEEISHRLEEKNIQIHLDIKEELLLKQVNHDLLFQLFYNLINNAIKFNKENGTIEIFDELLSFNQYQITVKDTGKGIAKAQIPFIFNRFRKSDQAENPGYGLGLAIVKSIAAYHQIDIQVNSEVDKGTSFRVIFNLFNDA
ncbi:sensor histidine kinase [Pedobacter puniceum]|uniref:histidine kinase n=1 Tax=Pedobacter puniceum TaxID=2666136 RepID=A0A7K0FL53_9SPHI|nr:HAMP domain-containing sensor histidine kinase [Pedobacter puniceum]MRX46135.1 sensor histidine kinase [Pedobacter puniceum]